MWQSTLAYESLSAQYLWTKSGLWGYGHCHLLNVGSLDWEFCIWDLWAPDPYKQLPTQHPHLDVCEASQTQLLTPNQKELTLSLSSVFYSLLVSLHCDYLVILKSCPGAFLWKLSCSLILSPVWQIFDIAEQECSRHLCISHPTCLIWGFHLLFQFLPWSILFSAAMKRSSCWMSHMFLHSKCQFPILLGCGLCEAAGGYQPHQDSVLPLTTIRCCCLLQLWIFFFPLTFKQA